MLAMSLQLMACVASADVASSNKDNFHSRADEILFVLRTGKYEETVDIRTTPVMEFFAIQQKKHRIRIRVSESATKQLKSRDSLEGVYNVSSGTDGMTLGRFLSMYLRLDPSLEPMAYLIRPDHIEIVLLSEANETVYGTRTDDCPPIMNMSVAGRPIGEVFDMLSREYDINIVVRSEARPRTAVKVETRMFNASADKALGEVARQAKLKVVRMGNTYFVQNGD